MILAEQILLLLTEDVTGKPVVDVTRLDLVLAGAVLLDLAVAARVDVAGPGDPVKSGRLIVRDARPVGDPILDEALSRILAAGPKKPESLLPKLKKDLRRALYARLADRRILRFEQARVLGIFSTERWPAVDRSHAQQMRAGLREVLVVGREPTEREAALIALLRAVDQVPKVLGTGEVSARELRRRAKLVVPSGLADTAVRKAIDAVNSATMAAVMVATTAGTASS
ncbi:Golgi phosphoprotein 3 (GPP34) [Sanguibacter gelidistatuariae]|uniref:Golgi phosphoprotein 3 (GPP34) n=1 Tax=Sanguibacter gelidistatuariae TaxID=1814289 RepID=A0A1G6Y225_9MICO|nr:GPP34 family phosphoprotein [Sanguibacter gelidistatuariae]SDD83767.1 Golgi phosphoprotein 3 (GPP34) [Sanguibacter gelidistatuariae]